MELLGDGSELGQVMDYYPFGMVHKGQGLFEGGQSSNRYRFNGIEVVEEFDLEIAPFRSYDATIGRWGQVDPVYKFHESGYAGLANNPVLYADAMGLDTIAPNSNSSIDPKAANTLPEATVTAKRVRSSNPEIDETGQRQCTNCPTVVTGDDDLQETAPHTIVTARMEWNPLPESVGDPGTVGSMVPFYGPGRSALNDFQNERYWGGGVNTVIMISDYFLVRSIVTGVTRGGVSALSKGNASWNSYRAHYLKTGFAVPDHALHHWLIHRNGYIGKGVPNAVKNQMWNLVRMPGAHPHCNIHKALHGGGALRGRRLPYTLYWGTPSYFKAVPGSIGGRMYVWDY